MLIWVDDLFYSQKPYVLQNEIADEKQLFVRCESWPASNSKLKKLLKILQDTCMYDVWTISIEETFLSQVMASNICFLNGTKEKNDLSHISKLPFTNSTTLAKRKCTKKENKFLYQQVLMS